MPSVKDLQLIVKIMDREISHCDVANMGVRLRRRRRIETVLHEFHFAGDLLSADDELCVMTVPLYKHFAVATSGEMRDLWLEPGECICLCGLGINHFFCLRLRRDF